jgi:putative DNA methylase
MRHQHWTKESPVTRLMSALVHAAPEAVRFEKGKKSAAALFPEFRAWHALLAPLFGITPPEWKEVKPAQAELSLEHAEAAEDEDSEEHEGGEEAEE